MAHRTFIDSAGLTWEVWDVQPGRLLWGGAERRAGDDRRMRPAPGIDPDADERRRPDRRAAVAAALRRGWLAFQAGVRRRRLAPVPAGWADAPDRELERYCRLAQPQPQPPRSDA